MTKYIALACGLLLCACARNSGEPAYYTLGDNPGGTAISAKKMSIDVGRIKIPEYIDRPQMVTTSGVNVNMVQEHRWAEGLSPMIQRRLISGLRKRLTGASVKSSDFVGAVGDYAVFVEVYSLDGAVPGTVRMDAMYSIMADGNAARTRRVEYSAECGDSYADYAAGIGTLVDDLARSISRDLDKMEK